VLWHCCRSGSH